SRALRRAWAKSWKSRPSSDRPSIPGPRPRSSRGKRGVSWPAPSMPRPLHQAPTRELPWFRRPGEGAGGREAHGDRGAEDGRDPHDEGDATAGREFAGPEGPEGDRGRVGDDPEAHDTAAEAVGHGQLDEGLAGRVEDGRAEARPPEAEHGAG